VPILKINYDDYMRSYRQGPTLMAFPAHKVNDVLEGRIELKRVVGADDDGGRIEGKCDDGRIEVKYGGGRIEMKQVVNTNDDRERGTPNDPAPPSDTGEAKPS
jgi:hypothetical protein